MMDTSLKERLQRLCDKYDRVAHPHQGFIEARIRNLLWDNRTEILLALKGAADA